MARDDRRQRREYVPEKKEFMEQVIDIDRVSRVVKGGRRFRFRALVVIGDGKKRVGVGVSKGADVQAAISKAVEVAKKDMIEISTYKTTIPHEIQSRFSGAKILLKPASPGTGIIAGGTIRAVLDVTGIKDVLSKSIGSSNKVNVAYATIEALGNLVPASEWVTTTDKKSKTAPKEADSKSEEKKEASKTEAKPKKKEAKK